MTKVKICREVTPPYKIRKMDCSLLVEGFNTESEAEEWVKSNGYELGKTSGITLGGRRYEYAWGKTVILHVDGFRANLDKEDLLDMLDLISLNSGGD